MVPMYRACYNSLTMAFKPISFPDDHSSHTASIEWWYWNGHLADKKGNRYAFMDCFFKTDISKITIPHFKAVTFEKFIGKNRYAYFAHSVVSDITNQKNYKEIQDISMVSDDSFKRQRFFLNYIDPIIIHGYDNNEMAEIAPDVFHIKSRYLDLNLKSHKPALLEGGEGHTSVCGRDSYYYSLTDLSAKGVLTINGKRTEVEGKAWMDHQWMDVTYELNKWSWFSIQLDNGTEIMCCEYDKGTDKTNLVDLSTAHRDQKHFSSLILKPGTDTWKSKLTKAEYPMSWDIEIPDHKAILHAHSLMSDQEMIFAAINYWEGPIEITGTIDGKDVKGTGFMELVGYPADYSYLLSLGREVKKEIIGNRV